MVGRRPGAAVKIGTNSPTPRGRFTFENLLSKVTAAGLAAGVFLL
jgi:hypothetical protein